MSSEKGPFVPGDRIGFENENILAKAYNKDGLLLQMGDSIKPINEIIKSKVSMDVSQAIDLRRRVRSQFVKKR